MPLRSKRNRLPKKIKIANLNYSVSMVDQLRDHKNDRLYGQHRPVDQEIRLDRGMEKDREKEVLLHEILHSLWDIFDLPVENEEHFVECLGNGLAMVLHDNPKLRRYLDD